MLSSKTLSVLSSLLINPLSPRIHVKGVGPEEAYQCHAQFLGELNGQTGRGTYGGYKPNPGHAGFLNQFKTSPTAQQQQVLTEGKLAGLEGCSYELIQGIVPAYILSY